jgi:hypothetical protein
LNPNKTVQSITLPGGGNVEILAMTLLQPGSRVGSVPNGTTFPIASSLDGNGLAIPINALGSSLLSQYAVNAANIYNAISAVGQLVPVAQRLKSGSTTLNILAVGVNGSQLNQPITLNYTNRPPQTVFRSFSDWTSFQQFGDERKAATFSSAAKFDGTQVPGTFNLYIYQIPLSGNLESITLPNDPNLEIVGLQAS